MTSLIPDPTPHLLAYVRLASTSGARPWRRVGTHPSHLYSTLPSQPGTHPSQPGTCPHFLCIAPTQPGNRPHLLCSSQPGTHPHPATYLDCSSLENGQDLSTPPVQHPSLPAWYPSLLSLVPIPTSCVLPPASLLPVPASCVPPSLVPPPTQPHTLSVRPRRTVRTCPPHLYSTLPPQPGTHPSPVWYPSPPPVYCPQPVWYPSQPPVFLPAWYPPPPSHIPRVFILRGGSELACPTCTVPFPHSLVPIPLSLVPIPPSLVPFPPSLVAIPTSCVLPPPSHIPQVFVLRGGSGLVHSTCTAPFPHSLVPFPPSLVPVPTSCVPPPPSWYPSPPPVGRLHPAMYLECSSSEDGRDSSTLSVQHPSLPPWYSPPPSHVPRVFVL